MISCDLPCELMGHIVFLDGFKLISLCFTAIKQITKTDKTQYNLLLAKQLLNHNTEMEKKLDIKKCLLENECWEIDQASIAAVSRHNAANLFLLSLW